MPTRITIAATLILSCSVPAQAQVRASGYDLPAQLAIEAASEAVRFCESKGYKVSAAVVDDAGRMKAFIRGDHSATHTNETAFRKAYTQVTMGPIFGFDALRIWIERMRDNPGGSPSAASLLTVPNIILIPGAVAIKANGEIVAAIGVGGAPGGEKDEACAAVGLAAIRDRLPL